MAPLEQLRRSLWDCPIIRKGTYEYFVHPLTDGIPATEPGLLEEAAEGLLEIGDFRCDLIVTIEALGLPLAAALSLKTGRPYNVVRKKSYGLPGERAMVHTTGYSRGELFINGIYPGIRVTLVDDVISTGGTLRSVVSGLRELGAEIVDIVAVFDKCPDKAALERELGCPIRTLLRVEIRNGRVIELPASSVGAAGGP